MSSVVQIAFGDFESEMSNTRKVLERVPEDQLAWQPHAKSMTLGRLAYHIASLPWFAELAINTDEYDMAHWKPDPDPTSRQQILDRFDSTLKAANAALAKLGEDDLAKPWSLKMGDQVFFTLSKAAVLRTFAINHIVHHRAQLLVYLRSVDVPIPGLYGPSADEQ